MFLVTKVLRDLVHGWVWGPGEEVRVICRMLRQRRRSPKVLCLGLVMSVSRAVCALHCAEEKAEVHRSGKAGKTDPGCHSEMDPLKETL